MDWRIPHLFIERHQDGHAGRAVSNSERFVQVPVMPDVPARCKDAAQCVLQTLMVVGLTVNF
jgi:hypothetical protein